LSASTTAFKPLCDLQSAFYTWLFWQGSDITMKNNLQLNSKRIQVVINFTENNHKFWPIFKIFFSDGL